MMIRGQHRLSTTTNSEREVSERNEPERDDDNDEQDSDHEDHEGGIQRQSFPTKPGNGLRGGRSAVGSKQEIVVKVVGSSSPRGTADAHNDDDCSSSKANRSAHYRQQQQQQQQLPQGPSSPVRPVVGGEDVIASSNAYSPSWGLRFARTTTAATSTGTTMLPQHLLVETSSPSSALKAVRSRHHAYARLAVQQVRTIERYRRNGVPLPHVQPKTAEQFYQWLNTAAPSATSKTTSSNKSNGAKEYRLGLRHDDADDVDDDAARRRRRDITVVPARHDDDSNECSSNGSRSDDNDDDNGSERDSNAYSSGRYTDEDASDGSDDEGTAVAVATMMMPTATSSSASTSVIERSRAQKSPRTTGSVPLPPNEAMEAWREASRIVSDCHARMVSVQENSKLKQQQLRLHNEHLQLQLESSKVTIEQLQMRLIFSTPSKPAQTTQPNDSTSMTTNEKPVPSVDDVRHHVESLLERQQAILKENAALKQSLLQCGCDRCFELYRTHQRANASGSGASVDVFAAPIPLGGSETPLRVGDPGESAAATNEIPMPSMVPTEGSSASSSSSTASSSRHSSHSATGSPAHLEPVGGSVYPDEAPVTHLNPLQETSQVPIDCDDDDAVKAGAGRYDESNQSQNESSQRVAANDPGVADPTRLRSDDNAEPIDDEDEVVVEMKRKRSFGSRRRSRRSSGGPSLGEYLTTQQEDGNTTTGSLDEHEYDRRYSRGFAESVSVLSSMSRITFKTIDEDITVDCSMMNDEGTSGVQDSTARLDESGDVSLLPIELSESERDRQHVSMDSSSDAPPARRSFVESASSITTSLSNDYPFLRMSSRSCEATVRNSNLRGATPTAMDPVVDVRQVPPTRRGRKPMRINHVAPTTNHEDVSLDQVYSLADPSSIVDASIRVPFVKPPAPHEIPVSPIRSTTVPPPPTDVEVEGPVPPIAPNAWQQKYVSSDDLYSSAVMKAMEKRKKGSTMLSRHARDMHSERFVAELSKCLQGGSTHSIVNDALGVGTAPEQALVGSGSSKAMAAVPQAMRAQQPHHPPPPLPLSYDDAIMAAMRKESGPPHPGGGGGGVVTAAAAMPAAPSAAVLLSSHRKGQWKAPAVFKSWK